MDRIDLLVGGYRHHDLFDRPESSVKIWRYLDFAKLVDLIDQRALFFTRADCMADPWEGGVSRFIEDAHVEELAEQLVALGENAVLGNETPVVGAQTLERIRHERRQVREQQRRRVFLSCWHLSDYESAAMWDLYAGRDGRGVAVQSSFARLELALPTEWKHIIYAGKVRYINYQREVVPSGNAFFPFLYKRLSFEHERELRAVFDTHDDDTTDVGFNVPVDLATLVERVYVAPTAPAWFADVVERIIARRYSLAIPVIHSDLLTGPVL